MLPIGCPVMTVKFFWTISEKKKDFGPKNSIFGPKFCIFLRYTYETPIFSARTVPTQWDHKSPISWGNSGYLQFSGRWPFGRLAGRFVAPIAQSGPFGVQKCCFWPETISLWTSCKGVNTKMLSFWCPVMMVTNKVGKFQKKWILGQKSSFLAQKSVFFYAMPIYPTYFASDGPDSMGS